MTLSLALGEKKRHLLLHTSQNYSPAWHYSKTCCDVGPNLLEKTQLRSLPPYLQYSPDIGDDHLFWSKASGLPKQHLTSYEDAKNSSLMTTKCDFWKTLYIGFWHRVDFYISDHSEILSNESLLDRKKTQWNTYEFTLKILIVLNKNYSSVNRSKKRTTTNYLGSVLRISLRVQFYKITFI